MSGEVETTPIRCQLFNHTLQTSSTPAVRYQKYSTSIVRYEALSYVWGDPNPKTPFSIYLNGLRFKVTDNLYSALRRLRRPERNRILWIDAICINQNDPLERAKQVQFMAKIYGQANNVLVWLGDAEDGSDGAFQAICAAQINTDKISQGAILSLLRRPWFRRIWVLQEVAAARDILILCGHNEANGHLFCDRLRLFKKVYEADLDLQSRIHSVSYLIRNARLRPRHVDWSKENVLSLHSLGELVDMFQTHEATRPHDKMYALLGMRSDGLDTLTLVPDYQKPWKQVLESFVKYILCDKVFVESWNDREIAIIHSKGCILGEVTSVKLDLPWEDAQTVRIKSRALNGPPDQDIEWTGTWRLPRSVRPIQQYDLLCLSQGASTPIIIRAQADHAIVIAIAATPPRIVVTESGRRFTWQQLLQSINAFPQYLQLIWDWEISSSALQNLEGSEILRNANEPPLDSEGYLGRATRMWHLAFWLKGKGMHEKAEERYREAIEIFEGLLEGQNEYSQTARRDVLLTYKMKKQWPDIEEVEILTLLVKPARDVTEESVAHILSFITEGALQLVLEWKGNSIQITDEVVKAAAGNWSDGKAVMRLLLERADSITDDAAVQIVRLFDKEVILLLLEQQGSNFRITKEMITVVTDDAENKEDMIRLILERRGDRVTKGAVAQIAREFDEQVMTLLLKRIRDDPHIINEAVFELVRSFSIVRRKGVVELLLEKATELDSKDTDGRTPLLWAAHNGDEVMVKLLLENGAELDSKDTDGRTPLLWTARNGHEAIVQLLLKKGGELDSKDTKGLTPLLWAAYNGHEAVVKLLLKNNADIWESLVWATQNGDEEAVKLLLDEKKSTELDRKDTAGRTLLLWAAFYGHVEVVKLLLEKGAELDSKDTIGRTPLLWAAFYGHEAVVELLLEKGATLDSQDTAGRTPLLWAVYNNHEGVVKLLLEKSADQ